MTEATLTSDDRRERALPASPPNDSLTRNRRILVTIGVMLALLLAALDSTIVGTALPRIVADLHGLDEFAWVVTAYLVAQTAMTPVAGKLGDLFGRKPLLVGGMIGFVLTSAICGLAQDMGQLIAFRAIQGIFGGVLIATVFASVADIYPPVARARMLGVLGGVFGLASIIGPTLGGYLTDNFSWRWVFYANLPVGAIALLFVFLTMPRVRTFATWRSIDFLGATALTGGLVPLLIAFSITQNHAWTSPEVLGFLAVATVVLVAFFFIERRQADPIVPFGLFRNRTFAVSVVASFVAGIGLFGTVIFVPLIYQGVLGTSATNSGALLTPFVGGLVVASVVGGQLITRMRHYRFLGTAGIAISVLGLWLLSQISPRSDSAEVVRDLVIIGLGIGTTIPLYLNAAQSAVSDQLTGVVTSQITFWRNVGATIGIAVLGSVLSQQLPGQIQAQTASRNLPPQVLSGLSQLGGNAQALFDPARLATLPAAVVEAIRAALANTLHDLFIFAAIAVALSAVVSVFLDDAPIGARHEPAEGVSVVALAD
jgi:EmrB/QacA subfamily drug resistance transporter